MGLFSSRHVPSRLARMWRWIWPRGGFARAGKYIGYRVTRLPGSTYSIAAGFACGVAASFLPFVGLHFILAAIVALVCRASVIASAVGTMVGNPWTFPLIWVATYKLGRQLGFGGGAGHPAAIDFRTSLDAAYHAVIGLDFRAFVESAWPVVKPMIVGGTIMGVAAGLVAYALFYLLISAARTRHKARVAQGRSRTQRLLGLGAEGSSPGEGGE